MPYLIGSAGLMTQAVTEILPYLKQAGVDIVWFGPMFKSPGKDHGYDVEDYFEINSDLGTKEDFRKFANQVHAHGMRLVIDLIPSHTSDQHSFFKSPHLRRRYYIRRGKSEIDLPNLFDSGSIWVHYEDDDYANLFHRGGQPALKWIAKGGDLNWDLIAYFHKVIDYWMLEFNVDGFRVDAMQAANINMLEPGMTMDDLLHYGRTDFCDPAVRTLNALFFNTGALVIMECLAPMGSGMIQYYLDNTPVDFVLEITMKDQMFAHGLDFTPMAEQAKIKGCMGSLFGHDAKTPVDKEGVKSSRNLNMAFFQSGYDAVCATPDQILGLARPTREQLSIARMRALDTEADMRCAAGEDPEKVWPGRAGFRVPFSPQEFKHQANNPNSDFNFNKQLIKYWKQSA